MKAAALITLRAPQVEEGRALADRFALPHIDASSHALTKPRQIEAFLRAPPAASTNPAHFVFLLAEEGLSLAQLSPDFFLSIRADFHGPTVRYRREKGGGKGQMIAKAVGLGGRGSIHVLDATAGLGSDAFVLASLGCQVTLLERVPEVRALLADALTRAKEWGRTHDPQLIPILLRMRLIEADALVFMRDQAKRGTAPSCLARGAMPGEARRAPREVQPAEEALESTAHNSGPDVVYLDPMFPPRSKSAQVKKEMRVFHQLIGTDPDAAELLPAALQCARQRVVVKRPRLAASLGDAPPSYALEGKSNRFDVYIPMQ